MSTASESDPRWFDAAAGAHRRLLQRPEAGQRLAGVEDRGIAPRGVARTGG